MEDHRYPIGEFSPPSSHTPADVRGAIETIAACPRELRAAVAGLDDARLETPYRDGGWTVRQLVHHIADSHMNAYIRCKLAVAENQPRIKTYEQDDWAKFDDASHAPITVSLDLIEALHERWVRFLRSLPDSAFDRKLDHPEIGVITLAYVVFLYAWHGRHHTTQISSLRKRKGWK
ncbi:MAG TPA: putative metal-dependent hydrolase [Candidatus Krumholzibacteria bacterium]|nr:putative metal-dependent hydrolase [Candidatus Krumholzibacteria bacterium]